MSFILQINVYKFMLLNEQLHISVVLTLSEIYVLI